MPGQKIPLVAKLIYSGFVAVLVPFYLHEYGPTNFLYFCDVALLMTLAAMWLESPLLASMPAVGILLPQTLWIVDFLLLSVGMTLTGMTGYMFDEQLPLFTRFLSFFHFWLPLLLAWLVGRLGYDRRAFKYWTVLAWALVLVCYFFMPPPPAPIDQPNLPVNINYVYGFSATESQASLPPLVYLGMMMLILWLVIFWPTHVLLKRCFTKPISAA